MVLGIGVSWTVECFGERDDLVESLLGERGRLVFLLKVKVFLSTEDIVEIIDIGEGVVFALGEVQLFL